MKEKLKISPAGIISILKASLLGVVTSILLVLLFAFILKFVNINSNIITIVDQIIKIISIFVAIFALFKAGGNKLLLRGMVVGAVYSVLSFIVFSMLKGGVNFTVGLFTDILFSALVGGVSAILLNIIKKK